jgi:hypothetical protein
VGNEEITGAKMTQEIVSCELMLPFNRLKSFSGLGRIKTHEIRARILLFMLANVAIHGEEYDPKKCQFNKLFKTLTALNNYTKYVKLFDESEKSFMNKHGNSLEIVTTNVHSLFSKLFAVRNLLTNYEWEYGRDEKKMKLTSPVGTYLGKD